MQEKTDVSNTDGTHPLDVALQASINGRPDISENILRSLPQDDLRVLFNLGWHEMRHGKLKEGLSYMNFGRYINVFGLPSIPGRIWKDEPLKNKTLLFRCEGGFGDQILNFRFAKNFEKMGARVLVSCSTELMPLFSRNGYTCIDSKAVNDAYYDYWVPAMSAAYTLGLEYADLDGEAYITPLEKRVLFSKTGGLKVGIRWSGNPEFEHEQHRRFPENLMIDLHTVEGTELYSLQRDDNTVEGLKFADLADQMKGWEETASIIAGLDLVITSCTSIAHLSGALGVPTWITIPIMPYYTWALPGDRTPWYNSVRLFRQTEYGKWDDVFSNVKRELTNKAKEWRTQHA
jgi:hypothetical protein